MRDGGGFRLSWHSNGIKCSGIALGSACAELCREGVGGTGDPDPTERSRGGRLMFMPEGGSLRLIASALLSEVSAPHQVSSG